MAPVPGVVWLVFDGAPAQSGTPRASHGSGVLRSTDGGNTWLCRLLLDPGDSGTGILRSSFTDARRGWLTYTTAQQDETEPFRLARTTDGGASWLHSPQRDTYAQWVAGAVTTQNVSTVPSSEDGLIWLPTGRDGGSVRPGWRSSHREMWLGSGSMPSEVGGHYGELARSRDAGGTWKTELVSDESYTFHSLLFTDQLNGWAAGGSEVLGTSDGGGTWVRELQTERWVEFLHFAQAGDDLIVAGWAQHEDAYHGHVALFRRHIGCRPSPDATRR
ncbi:MAG: hypothetical protein FJ000_00185 [Actinobacteria bacterium]|nr:hypothetical protein [Actinomycetota bacterium]